MPVSEPAYTYRAVVRSIYDGDTIRVDLDLGFETWVHNQPLRLHGIDAPEVRGAERERGLRSKDWLLQRIPPGTRIVVQTLKDARGKYGRYLAVLWHDGADLNSELVGSGMAEPYRTWRVYSDEPATHGSAGSFQRRKVSDDANDVS